MFINSPLSIDTELDNARKLLYNDEESLPLKVKQIIEFCVSKKISFILSRNIKVFSCKDARSNRKRLGHIGIPLFQELKSIVFKGTTNSRKDVVIATHCRGHVNIDVDKICRLCSLNERPTIMPQEELIKRYGMDFGTVNPFLFELNSRANFINIFDENLIFKSINCFGTMMTNAGDHTWGIEFEPQMLIDVAKNSRVELISTTENTSVCYDLPQIIPRSIGIICGNGVGFGIELWRIVISNFRSALKHHFNGDISCPEIKIHSLPILGLSVEFDQRKDFIEQEILKSLETISNIDLLALTCLNNYCFDTKIRCLTESTDGSFISMAETVVDYIVDERLTDVAFISVNFDFFNNYKELFSKLGELNIEVLSTEFNDKIVELVYEVNQQSNLYSSFRKFLSLLNQYIKSENIIIISQELSLLYYTFKNKKYIKRNIADILELYAKKIACVSCATDSTVYCLNIQKGEKQ
jgi:aspartate/glutamate racemase/prolyl-tRNA editing enzyme YbaK/EbsC (Cys-tRNA(Pro) deacylase)